MSKKFTFNIITCTFIYKVKKKNKYKESWQKSGNSNMCHTHFSIKSVSFLVSCVIYKNPLKFTFIKVQGKKAHFYII